MNQFALLLRHAASFARDHGLPFDSDLMSVVLHRRGHDDLSPTYWPTATLDDAHCADVLVTAGAAAAEVDRTVATYLEFLQTTGRLESAARDNHPAGMGRRAVARRLRPRGPRHGAVPGARPLASSPLTSGSGASGSLPELRGTTLTRPTPRRPHVPGSATRSRYGAGVDRVCPRPDGDGSGGFEGDGVDAFEAAGRGAGFESADLRSGAYVSEWLDGGNDAGRKGSSGHGPTGGLNDGPVGAAGSDRAAVPQPDVSEVAREVRASRYVANSLALARWVGAGRATTATDHLTPQVGRDAYVAVGLDRDDPARDAWLGWEWTNAADCHAVNRLWWPLIDAGLLNISEGRAVSQLPRPAGPDGVWSDGQLVEFAHALYVSLLRTLSVPARQIIVGTLFAGLVSRRHTVHRDEVAEWFAQLNNLGSQLPHFSLDDMDSQTCARRCVDLTLPEMHDFGAWRVDGATVYLGPLGVDLARTTSGYLDAGVITITAP